MYKTCLKEKKVIRIQHKFIIAVLVFFMVFAAVNGNAAVTSTGEINVAGDNQGIVPASSTVTLIATLVVDRSLAEPGEEIKTFEILIPNGFVVQPSNFRSISRDGQQIPAIPEVSTTTLRVVLVAAIVDFSNSRYDIVFDSRTPNITTSRALFRVRLRNLKDQPIGEFIKPGQADGKKNNDDFTLQVIPNVPPAGVFGFTAEADQDGENDVTLKWQKSDDPDVNGYFIYRGLDPPIRVENRSATVFRDVNVTPGTHNYAIEAYKTPLLRSKRSESVQVVVKTDTARPKPPEQFTITGSGDTITMTWNSSSSRDVVKYQISFGSSQTQLKPLAEGEIDVEASKVEYEFIDRRLLGVGIFTYAIEAIDEADNRSESVTQILRILGEPAPNPFTPLSSNPDFNQVVFPARAIEDAEGEFTVLVFNINGVLVKELKAEPGTRELKWDGRDERGEIVESGVYVYQMQVGESFKTGTLIVAK